MAKKKFNISSTLNKNKETKLADKIPLKKTTKDIEVVKEKVEQIHPEKVAPVEPTPRPISAKPKPRPAKVVAPPVEEKKVKLVRMTIDTPEDMHKRLKIKSIERGISLRDFVLKLIEKELK